MKGSSQTSSCDKIIPKVVAMLMSGLTALIYVDKVILIHNSFLVVYRVGWTSYLVKYILGSILQCILRHALILVDLCCLWVGQMTHGKVVLVTAATLGT
jgi:hypothetical protein